MKASKKILIFGYLIRIWEVSWLRTFQHVLIDIQTSNIHAGLMFTSLDTLNTFEWVEHKIHSI